MIVWNWPKIVLHTYAAYLRSYEKHLFQYYLQLMLLSTVCVMSQQVFISIPIVTFVFPTFQIWVFICVSCNFIHSVYKNNLSLRYCVANAKHCVLKFVQKLLLWIVLEHCHLFFLSAFQMKMCSIPSEHGIIQF